MSLITLNTDLQQHYLQHEFSQKATLIEEPIGWRSSNKKISRDKKTWEFVEKNAKDIQFIGKGREYLLEVDANFGVNTKVQYTIVTQNPKDAKDFFKDIYFIEMESLKDKKGKISCKIDEGGLAKLLKSKQNDKIEIDRTTSLDGAEITELQTENLMFEGRNIFLKTIFKEGTDNTVKTDIYTYGGYRTSRIPFPLEIKSNSHLDLAYSPLVYADIDDDDPNINITPQELFFTPLDRDRKIKIEITGSFWVKLLRMKRAHDNIYRKLSFYILDEDYNIKEEINFWDDPTPKSRTRKKIEFSKTLDLDLVKGDCLAFLFVTGGDLSETSWLFDYEGYYDNEFQECEIVMEISEDSSIEPTESKCVTAHEMCERHLEIITGKRGKFYSELLGNTSMGYERNGIASFNLIYSFLWVRGFDERDKKRPSISAKTTIESICAIWGASTMIEKKGFSERLRLEPLDFFYNRNITGVFPNVVEDLEWEYAKDFIYSNYQIGYEKGGTDYSEATGIGEYNGKSEFTSFIDYKENILNVESKLRADSSAVEFARRKYNQIQEDTDYDDDWGISDTKLLPSEKYTECTYSDHFDELPKGIYSPETAKNLRLTPYQMLQRRKMFVSGALGQYPNKELMFASSNCNADLELVKEGVRFKENQNTPIKDFGKQKFKPKMWKCKHIIDYDLQKKLRGKTEIDGKMIYNFYGTWEFRVSETEIKRGFLFEVNENKGEITFLEAV